jgi:hypothetical protein
VTNVDTGILPTTQTDQAGAYNVPFLPAGTYRIEVDAKGFSIATNPSTNLHAGDSLRRDFSLLPGNVQQSVTVTAEAPLLQTSDTTTVETLEKPAVDNLPIQSLNLASVAVLGPGMQPSSNGTSNTLAGIFTGGFTITSNGIRDSANLYTIDGASVNIGLYKLHSCSLCH